MLYTLNILRFCQLYLRKAEKRRNLLKLIGLYKLLEELYLSLISLSSWLDNHIKYINL